MTAAQTPATSQQISITALLQTIQSHLGDTMMVL
jgi:hypothetical protein